MRVIFGIILISLGVVLILGGVWESYNIFSAKKDVPQIFKLEQEEAKGTGIEDAISEQLGKVIPKEHIQRILNMAAWAMFMFILIVAGGKLSSIGIKLMRKND